MEFSRIRDRLKKEFAKKAVEFLKKNVRYFTATALFATLVLVLATCASPQKSDGNAVGIEKEARGEEKYQVDAYQDVNSLISKYYTAYAAGDIVALGTVATPISTKEQSYISMFSQYVDAYQNQKYYTKKGLDANSYLVSVYVEIKFAGVDAVAPGLDFFYVRTNEEGKLYIDNLYSQYNLANQENALDTSVQNLIHEFENDEDVLALQREVQEKYDSAVVADENLSVMINSTIPSAVSGWLSTRVEQNTEELPESTEKEQEASSEEGLAEEKTPVEETTQKEQETVYAMDKVNVRSSADVSADKIGSLQKGAFIARTGIQGDWSVVDYGGKTGYIKSEYLTTDHSAVPQDVPKENPETPVENIAQDTVVTLKETVNIRSGSSETSDKIGTAYAGEKVTVGMSYAEGWTKVTWNGKSGYIKTSLLQ